MEKIDTTDKDIMNVIKEIEELKIIRDELNSCLLNMLIQEVFSKVMDFDELNDSLQIKINVLINKNKNNLLSAKA